MKSKALRWAVSTATVLALAAASNSFAQRPTPLHFSGLINDYTPLTINNKPAGPWEMRGKWTLTLDRDGDKADFSAVMNMTHSDYWVDVVNIEPNSADDNSAMTGRHPHTHHITVQDATVTPLNGGGFEVSGPVVVTADGAAAPFMPNCTTATPCTLTVDITGGTAVQYSNITMTFGGPTNGPTSHFGTQAIHGFVRFPDKSDNDR
ncbi:MAG: hypothetical protein ACRD4S_17195 [Candidatus Acidiferrales bacterium]